MASPTDSLRRRAALALPQLVPGDPTFEPRTRRRSEGPDMEIEATTTEIIMPPVTSPIHGGAFGIRPSTGRPHSINLFGAQHEAAQTVPSRGADLLLCVGIGAALMYYLDRDRGSQRRSVLGTALEDLALTVIGRVASRVRGD